MHHPFLFLTLLFWLECCILLTHAQKRGVPRPEGPRPAGPPEPVPMPRPHLGEPISPGRGGGTPSQGKEPNVPAEDNEVDIEEIGNELYDLIDNISSLVDVIQSSSTDDTGSLYAATIYATQTTALPFPRSASGCTAAQSAYATCYSILPSVTSSAAADFPALPRTQQASCLCNASPGIDFNKDMKDCYNYAQAQSSSYQISAQFLSYASVIANATALCAPNPCTTAAATTGGGMLGGIIGQEACATGGGPSPSPTPPPSAPTIPPTSGGSRAGDGGGAFLLPVALICVMFISMIG